MTGVIVRTCSCLAAVVGLLALGPSAAAAHAGQPMSPATERQLARARSATAKYHDVEQAVADGYVDIGLYESGEGFHFVKPSLVDGEFDPAQPEILLYAPVPGEKRLQLVAVEYIVPLVLSPSAAPGGFIGSADGWREDSENFGMWELTVWIWEHNPNGIFANLNPRVP
jgi:hypothetical protein